MRSIAAALVLSLPLMGASCPEQPSPPSAVEVRVPVPVPCKVAEPECQVPAYNGAKKEQPMDDRLKLLRAEAIEQADCIRRYREALASCREAVK